MEVQLAKQHGAGIFQPAHYLGIFRGNPFLEQLACPGRPNAGRIDVVLQGDGNPVEGASPFPSPLFGLHLPRGRECLISGDRNESVHR
jgi:hypothetical protein